MVVGRLVEDAAVTLRRLLIGAGLLGETFSAAEFAEACRTYHARVGALRASARYQPSPGLRWDDERYQGDAYGTYAWAVYVAEVTVDLTTFEIRVDDFVAVQEVGKVINPVLATGQIEGGVAQGIGWALHEQVVWREGRMLAPPDDPVQLDLRLDWRLLAFAGVLTLLMLDAPPEDLRRIGLRPAWWT